MALDLIAASSARNHCCLAVECDLQHAADKVGNLRLLRCTGTRNVQPLDAVVVEKGQQTCGGGLQSFRETACAVGLVVDDGRRVARQMERRLAEPPRACQGQCGAAADMRRDGKQDSRVTVAYIPFGPLRIFARRRFMQVILRCQWAVLGESTSRTPPAVRKARLDGEVQRRAIGPGLAA
jgi:hypothetical protein